MTGYTPPNFLLAQEAHFFAALAFTLGGIALGFQWWFGAGVILLVAAIKEATFDRIVEHQPARDSVVDWLFYLMGVLVGLGLYWLKLL